MNIVFYLCAAIYLSSVSIEIDGERLGHEVTNELVVSQHSEHTDSIYQQTHEEIANVDM
jgi:hypothetical protein